MRVAIVGAAGYTGGELLRLLLDHPEVSEIQAGSESQAGKFVWSAHPNLRKRTDLRFVGYADLRPADVVFLALPHGEAMRRLDDFRPLGTLCIDLSADHRLRDAGAYDVWYGEHHPHPDRLAEFVYGVPELHRERIRRSRQLSGAGCNATAVILGVLPLARAGVIDRERPIVAEAKVGSSEGGREASEATHHPERSGAVRSFAPVGHRHTAEMEQELDHPRVDFSGTSIEMVRGVLATAHVPITRELDEKALWSIYREAYGAEPFVRIVKERSGIYRYPEPKILAGSNFCDVGFALDPRGQRVVVVSAIDNLVKGAAGNCVQAMNVACGFDEVAGLRFPGLHP
ncbi:MAG TPA: N-acetyl-gamma-glutamyl-phosphate reductase [Candidatus Dormibacteraeota bacterium]|jgi:N-acetyl-gamma-glutamyl-phosphate/LysW-gamma-L-alpha-aminoadipyl-6-phosphate reductase|nr:N-acetyl-gamma-glutamyl-phosphate reductase [Candidatus Dormibacteraeota bacterium]